MPLAPDIYTAEMVRALPEDGKRYEVVHGELLVTPAPRSAHQRIAGRLYRRLSEYCDAFAVGEAMFSPSDISWSADTLVQPDVFVVAPQDAYDTEWEEMRSLRLVAEVLSPSTARHDRNQKRALYQANGVAMIWLVDGDRRTVEVWTPAALVPTLETERLTWHPEGAPEPFVIAIADLLK